MRCVAAVLALALPLAAGGLKQDRQPDLTPPGFICVKPVARAVTIEWIPRRGQPGMVITKPCARWAPEKRQ